MNETNENLTCPGCGGTHFTGEEKYTQWDTVCMTFNEGGDYEIQTVCPQDYREILEGPDVVFGCDSESCVHYHQDLEKFPLRLDSEGSNYYVTSVTQ